MISMRAFPRVSLLLAVLLVSAVVGAAHRSVALARGGKAGTEPRSRQASARLAPGPRARGAVRGNPPEQLSKNSVVMRSHRIVRGDSLSAIAALYGTTVHALAAANGLGPSDVIRTGQELVIPQQARPGGGSEWLKYARQPEQPGKLELYTYRSQFRGRVVENGRVSPAARGAISSLLGAKGSRPAVPERLIRLLVRVSDTFGGRPIRVVSGYRTSSYFADSRHKQSAAVDFYVAGVPNAVVRQYLLLFDEVGVGYYPNSSFLHLDVRDSAMQWVDYAGPGEAPRLRPSSPRFAKTPRFGQTPSVSDLDEIAEGVVAAMENAPSAAAAPEVPADGSDETPPTAP
jgi:LysM repeat protein